MTNPAHKCPERKRKVVRAVRNDDRTMETPGDQELRKVSELVGLALQAGRKIGGSRS